MDIVALQQAQLFAKKLPRRSMLSALTGRMRRGIEDVTLTILGDSTGNDPGEWVLLVAAWLGARYPGYTVLHRLWNDTNQNYDTATTVSTGTAGRTLTIYNGSTSGMAANYSTARLALQVPVTPTAFIINYGHNSAGTTARQDNYPLVRALREKWPFAPITVTAQNPRVNTDGSYATDLARQQSVIDMAQSEGLGLINVLGAFLANPTYATDWLLGDGLHPSSAGSIRWAQEVEKHLADDTSIVPAFAPADAGRMFIPAIDFAAAAGTPTWLPGTDPGPMWSLPNAGTTSLRATVDVPPSWDMLNLFALWVQVSASGFTVSNNQIITQTRIKGMGAADYAAAAAGPQNGPVIAWFTVSAALTLVANNTGGGARKITYLGQEKVLSFGHGSPISVEFTRLGDNASDNNADALLFLGIELVRQT